MQGRDIVPREKACISQCIIQFWSGSQQDLVHRDERYERCLTNCNVCGSAGPPHRQCSSGSPAGPRWSAGPSYSVEPVPVCAGGLQFAKQKLFCYG